MSGTQSVEASARATPSDTLGSSESVEQPLSSAAACMSHPPLAGAPDRAHLFGTKPWTPPAFAKARAVTAAPALRASSPCARCPRTPACQTDVSWRKRLPNVAAAFSPLTLSLGGCKSIGLYQNAQLGEWSLAGSQLWLSFF